MGPVSYNTAEYTIIPSDPHTLWVSYCGLSTQFEGKTEQEIIETILSYGWLYYRTGTQTNNDGLPTQDAEYTIYVVGCMQQQATTGLFTATFRAGKQDFDFTGDAYTEVTKLNYIVEGTADWSKGYVSVSATLTPNESTTVYRALCGPAESYENLSDEELGMLIEQEWDEGQWHPDGIWFWDADKRIPVNGQGMIATLSRDATGKSGRLNRYIFTAEPFGDPGSGGDPIIGNK